MTTAFELKSTIKSKSALLTGLALATTLAAACNDDPVTPEPPADVEREALVALYNSTGGSGWTRKDNWLSDGPVGEWQGVGTNEAGKVTVLRLDSNGLAGPLPADRLTGLEERSPGSSGIWRVWSSSFWIGTNSAAPSRPNWRISRKSTT